MYPYTHASLSTPLNNIWYAYPLCTMCAFNAYAFRTLQARAYITRVIRENIMYVVIFLGPSPVRSTVFGGGFAPHNNKNSVPQLACTVGPLPGTFYERNDTKNANKNTLLHCPRRNNSPSALELKCIEVWLISCTLFVFLALVEYFVVLFGMRYDKHWRHKKRDLDRDAGGADSGPSRPGAFNMSTLFGSSKVHAASGNNTGVVADNANLVGGARGHARKSRRAPAVPFQ